MYSQNYNAQFFNEDEPCRKPLSRGKIFMIVSAAIVLAATAGLTLFSMEKIVSVKYEHALALLDSNDYLKAKEEFLCFSGYRDSAAKAKECQESMDFNYAEALFKSGDYASAKEIFAALGDFKGARDKTLECDYRAATALMDSGKLEEAENAFLALGGYLDSKEQAEQCRNELDYTAADELLSRKDYAGALGLFSTIAGYKDSADKAAECQNNIGYTEADTAFKEKKYYTAYTGFMRLGNFSDSAKRAAGCIQKKPGSGQIYRNSKYKSKTCPLVFKSPKDGYCTFIKVYNYDVLICSVFIAPGKKVTVKLPAATYQLKEAIGKIWFGPGEAFGDNNAYYSVSEDLRLQKGTISTLTLRAKKGNMDSSEIGRSDF